MKVLLSFFFLLQVTSAHLLQFPLSTIVLKFENEDEVRVTTRDEALTSLMYHFGDVEVEIPSNELRGLLKINIASVSLSSTDMNRVKSRLIEFDFVSAELGESTVRFYFEEQEYTGRIVTGPPNPEIGRTDPFGDGDRISIRKLLGKPEEQVVAE